MSVSPWILFSLLAAAGPDEELQLRPDEPRFAIQIPDVTLTDVPVERIVITARDRDGKFDRTFNGRPLIHGIRLMVEGQDVALPDFVDGVLELTTDLKSGRRVYITQDEIVVDPQSRRKGVKFVPRVFRWFALVPPVLAIVLAIWLRNIIVALFAGIWSGGVILAHGNVFEGLVETLETFLLRQLAGDESRLMIVLFTMFLGAMVGVMSRGGGTRALVSSLAGYTQKRESGQVMTWALGLVVFFDDYANVLLVGSTMRPVTDRLRISREKLAFLVDSTAAPVAGLAILSTWVGVEIGYIQSTYDQLGLEAEGYTTFLATLPYRFYALHLLVFVWLIAYSGHDYGPMLKAEARAISSGQLHRPGISVPCVDDHNAASTPARRQLLRTALIPVVTLFVLIVVGLWWTGSDGLQAANSLKRQNGEEVAPATLWAILQHASSNRVLFFSSFAASLVAIVSATASRSITLSESMDAWLEGAKSMFLAVVILVLAWGVAAVCNEQNLNTAGFLVELTRGRLSVNWMPSLAFVLAGCVAVATGSSWSTLGLLMPLFISITHYLLVDLNEADPNHPILLATIGAVLAGAIFGDHCSPISDTTVLSSAAAGSDHLDHVTTQIPYAATVAAVSLLTGYVPVGFGYSPIVLLPLGLFVLYLLVQFLGRPAEEYAKLLKPAEDSPAPLPLGDAGQADDEPIAPPDIPQVPEDL